MNIKKILSEKFGKKAYETIVTDGTINYNTSNEELFKQSRDEQINHFISEGIINKKTVDKINLNPEIKHGWGFDFPGWLGDINKGKEIMIIGQEPNIQIPYFQIVYGFCSKNQESENEAAQRIFDKAEKVTLNKERSWRKIWYRVPYLFQTEDEQLKEVLKRIYITDLCPFGPFNCGQEKTIQDKIGKDFTDEKWKSIRKKTMEKFLIDEINAVNPKYILFQCKIDFNKLLALFPTDEINSQQKIKLDYPKVGWKIEFANWRDKLIIKVPHIGTRFNIADKFWTLKIDEVRNHILKRI